MARKLRYMPEPYKPFEVTIRTLQERFLLRPSAQLNDLILGIIGRALFLYPEIRIYLFKFLSDHYHMILSGPDVYTLARFLSHINSNIAREAGRLHHWHGKFWGRRYAAMSIEDDAELLAKTRYVLAQGCKEGLVPTPLDWPGVGCERALLNGEKLVGTWYDRSAHYEATRRGKDVPLSDFAQRYEVPLWPLPLVEGKSEEEQRAFYRELVDDIGQQTHQECLDTGKPLLGAAAVLAADPYTRARNPKRSPAPACHASTREGRLNFLRGYREFVSLYRQAAQRFMAGDANAKFPQGCFLPPGGCPPHLVDAAAPG